MGRIEEEDVRNRNYLEATESRLRGKGESRKIHKVYVCVEDELHWPRSLMYRVKGHCERGEAIATS